MEKNMYEFESSFWSCIPERKQHCTNCASNEKRKKFRMCVDFHSNFIEDSIRGSRLVRETARGENSSAR